MKVKKGKRNADNSGNHAYYFDLNEEKTQEKIVRYIRFGVPPSDSKHGHHVRLQTKVNPIQADILESIREHVPNGYWKSQSELLRSVISVGCYVTLKFLNNSRDIPEFSKEFKLLDILNLISRVDRENNLETEARKAIYAINSQPFDIESTTQQLADVVKKYNIG